MMLQKQLFSQLFIWLKPLIYLDVEDESQEIFSHKSQTFGPTRWQTQTSNPTQVVATQIFFEFSSLLGEDEPNLTSILGWNHQPATVWDFFKTVKLYDPVCCARWMKHCHQVSKHCRLDVIGCDQKFHDFPKGQSSFFGKTSWGLEMHVILPIFVPSFFPFQTWTSHGFRCFQLCWLTSSTFDLTPMPWI